MQKRIFGLILVLSLIISLFIPIVNTDNVYAEIDIQRIGSMSEPFKMEDIDENGEVKWSQDITLKFQLDTEDPLWYWVDVIIENEPDYKNDPITYLDWCEENHVGALGAYRQFSEYKDNFQYKYEMDILEAKQRSAFFSLDNDPLLIEKYEQLLNYNYWVSSNIVDIRNVTGKLKYDFYKDITNDGYTSLIEYYLNKEGIEKEMSEIITNISEYYKNYFSYFGQRYSDLVEDYNKAETERKIATLQNDAVVLNKDSNGVLLSYLEKYYNYRYIANANLRDIIIKKESNILDKNYNFEINIKDYNSYDEMAKLYSEVTDSSGIYQINFPTDEIIVTKYNNNNEEIDKYTMNISNQLCSFSLKSGEYVSLSIPSVLDYEVKETSLPGYETRIKINEEEVKGDCLEVKGIPITGDNLFESFSDNITFTNGYTASGSVVLSGSKILTGKSMDTFSFTLKEGDQVIETVQNDENGNIVFEIPYTIEDVGTHTYTITEENDNKGGITYDNHAETVTVEAKDNGDGTLATSIKTDEDGVVFNNQYSASGKLLLTGKKTLTGKSMDTFSFTLKEGDKTIETISNDKDGNITFSEIPYTLDDVGTHTYTIEEENDSKGGITYDTHIETITVEVTDNEDGTLNAEVTSNNTITFTNKYATGGTALITGQKNLSGKQMDTFSFELKEGSNVIETVNNSDNGQISFTPINYTLDDVGTHTYTITEVNDSKGGVTYDTHTETINVEVSDNGDGTLKTEVKTDEDGIVFNNSYSASGSTIISGTKNLSGKSMDTFAFTLKEGDKTIETVKNDKDGKFSFGEIKYTLDDVGTHTYTITEDNDKKPGVSYDTHSETVTVEVKDNGDGTLATSIKTDEDGIVFNNSYSATGETTISGKKNFTGKEMDTFTFTLKEGNKTIGTATNDKSGNFSFNGIKYTLNDVGTHTYTITEENDNKGGVTYDAHTETVTVDVIDNGDGTLKTEVKTDNDGVVFNNKYTSTGSVTFVGKKNLSGKEMDTFEFTLSEDKDIETVTNNEAGEITFSAINYTLDDVGTHTYTVTEKDTSKGGITYDTHKETITVEVTDNGDGTLKVTPSFDEDGVIFENKYTSTGSVTITALKELIGTEMREFEFILKENGEEIAKVKNDKDGKIVFPEITYTQAGEYEYTIEEVNSNMPGVTYDEHIAKVTVNVTDNWDGTLTSEITSDEVKFTNTYEAAGTFAITGLKKLEGRELKEGEFTFILTDENGKTYETTIDKDGNFSFSPFSFTLEDAGKIFTYKVTEKNENKESITYDEHTEEIKVTVEDNGDGTLKITPIYDEDGVVFENKYTEPEEIVEEETIEETTEVIEETTPVITETVPETTPETVPESKTTPETGDNTLNPYILLTILSSIGILCGIGAWRYRKNN